jgi:murein DD-endopeptidase MepM/ murein hydrolase activator NlpD
VASLIKTYKGDLTTSIAGVIYDRIKQIDDKRQLDKTGASEEVKQEAVKLKKEDSNAIQVQNRPLGEIVARFFTPLQGKFLTTNSKVDNLSVKANLIAGGIADTQKLLINRNQLLEDKFDQMLSIVGTKSAINKQKEAEANFEAMEKELEKGLDLSGTFAYEKTRTGTYGILGKLLSFILGNGFTRRITAQIIKRLVPKGMRARARLLRRSLLPVRKFAKRLSRPGTQIVRRLLQPFSIFLGKKGLGLAGRTLAQTAGFEALFGKRLYGIANPITKRLARKGLVGFFSGPLGRFFDRRSLAKTIKELKKTLDPADLKRLRKLGLANFLEGKAGTIMSLDRAGFRPGMKPITKKLTSNVAKKSASLGARKAPKKLVANMTEGVLARAFKSKAVQRLLLNKIGPEAMQKIGVKAAAGGVKGGFPIVGTGYAVIEGLVRLISGDPKGMLLSFGSGIPTAGWAFAIIDILRDIDRKAYDRHIEPNLPFPNDANIAAFFQDAIGLSPDQYERGNIGKAPIMGMGSDISSISSLVGVTKAFGEATGFGGEVGSLIAAAGLGNIKETTGYSFDISQPNLSRRSRDKKNSGIDPRILQMYPELDPNKPGDYIKLKRKTLPLDTAMNDEQTLENERIIKENEIQDSRWWIDPRRHLNFGNDPGEGGIGGATSQTPMMGIGGASTIEFYGQQGRDRSGEPGVDFSFKDYKNNYNLFPGYVLETGLLYGKGYGNVVVVRSTDPSNGKQFDSLYSHFPDGGIAVKAGQQVAAGDLLGSVGFVSVDTPGVPQLQPNNAGNMSGWHTSVDFFEPGSAARYSNADAIIKLITGSGGVTPHGLLEKLKPVTNQSSLNNVESNNRLATTMTNMVENGSNERLMTKRKASKRPPIVIINNQIVNTSQTQIAMGNNNKESGNFFEAYNLARYTV